MLQVHSLYARRGSRSVFRDITFALVAGDALLIKGANGSGKSSLLRVLAGLLPIAQGSILWNETPDLPPLHYMGHLDALKPELTVKETLNYWRTLYPDTAHQIFKDPFAINPFAHKPIRYLSAGQKRRVALSRLGLYQAPLWLLDEPTTALDSTAQTLLYRMIAAHRAAGGVIILATHSPLDIPDTKTLVMGQSKKEGLAA